MEAMSRVAASRAAPAAGAVCVTAGCGVAVRTGDTPPKERQRQAVLLRRFHDLTYQEIADLLGVGLSAVKMRIKRARQEFRQRYQSTPREEAAEV